MRLGKSESPWRRVHHDDPPNQILPRNRTDQPAVARSMWVVAEQEVVVGRHPDGPPSARAASSSARARNFSWDSNDALDVNARPTTGWRHTRRHCECHDVPISYSGKTIGQPAHDDKVILEPRAMRRAGAMKRRFH